VRRTCDALDADVRDERRRRSGEVLAEEWILGSRMRGVRFIRI
jgi:hypothetical protein